MARVTKDELRAVFKTATDEDLEVAIDKGFQVVEIHLANRISNANNLKIIEHYLSAHFYVINQQGVLGGVKSEGADGVKYEYYVPNGTGFNATTFGQQAVVMDATKTLASLSQPPTKEQASATAGEVAIVGL